jgi:hypothetical protein
MSNLRLLSVADTAAFRDRVQHDRCVHGGKQLDRSVLVAVASSRKQQDTAQLAAAIDALARDVLAPFPGQPTIGIISSDAATRSRRR